MGEWTEYALLAFGATEKAWRPLGTFRSQRAAEQAIMSRMMIEPEERYAIVEMKATEIRFFAVRMCREQDEKPKTLVIPAYHYMAAEAMARAVTPDPVTVWLHPDCPVTGFLSAGGAKRLVDVNG